MASRLQTFSQGWTLEQFPKILSLAAVPEALASATGTQCTALRDCEVAALLTQTTFPAKL